MNPRKTDSTARALEETKAVYAALAERPALRNCTLVTECCQFNLTGRVPMLTKGEALVAARGLRASGRKQLPSRKDGACPMLAPQTGRCMIYESRPFGCRTHFCRAAGGMLERREVLDLIRRLEAVDALLGGDGPHPLADAINAALDTL